MKLAFVDFWTGFINTNNIFLDLIKTFEPNVQVSRPSDCDILFFSCFGQENLSYPDKKRVFYTGENLRPNFDSIQPIKKGNYSIGKSDFALTFDFSDDSRNIRFPLWVMQIDWFNKKDYGNPKYVIPKNYLSTNQFYIKEKNKFCSFVFNNTAPFRWEFIEEMNKYKTVDCFGKPHGNWFYGEDTKLDIISEYKFNVCFENSSHPGYYTEKPIHAKAAGCVPIYWADKKFSEDFNKKAFIDLNDFNNVKDLVEFIIEIDRDDEKYKKIQSENIFNNDTYAELMLNNITINLKKILN